MGKTILYVPKSDIYPSFGLWRRTSSGDTVILIRDDLPIAIKEFLLDHELFHDQDKDRGDFDCDSWIENELEANWESAFKHPWGAFLTILYSLNPYRIIYYFKRAKEGK